MTATDRAAALEYAQLLEERERRKRERAIDYFEPYAKQREFLDLGGTHRTRLFSAAPQTGKTICGAYEAACHATGLYPKWWKGHRFDKPTVGWIGGITGELVRDNCQEKLFGPHGVPEALGSGFIPKACIDPKRISTAHGYQGFYDTAYVKHVSGGWSSIGFKTYSQGREKWQSRTLDWVWMDEESDIDLQNEAENRTRATNGILWTTYTPKKGRTALTLYLIRRSDHNAVVTMSIYDCPHIAPDQRKFIEETTPEWLKPAVIWGEPGAGTGIIFEVSDSVITEPAIHIIPAHWRRLWGIDFGGSGASKDDAHPFAAVLGAYDPDAQTIHVQHCIRMRKSEPMMHAKAMLPLGREIPVAWPHDGNKGVPGYGKPMASLYKAEGLKMLPSHISFPDGSISVEPGLTDMDQMMKTGHFKVASHLTEWFEEKRNYCYDDGQIVKIGDDLMSATRYMCMGIKRFGRRAADIDLVNRAPAPMCRDIDYDLWAA